MVGLGEEGGEWWLVHRNSCTSSAALCLRFLSGEPSCRLVGCFGCALLGIFCRSLGRRAALFSDFVESSIWECWRCRGPSPVRAALGGAEARAPGWSSRAAVRLLRPAKQGLFPGDGTVFPGSLWKERPELVLTVGLCPGLAGRWWDWREGEPGTGAPWCVPRACCARGRSAGAGPQLSLSRDRLAFSLSSQP